MNTNEQVASEISSRIASLEALSDDNLKNEMRALKASLIENPAACLLLHAEDIGKMVTALRKIVGTAISAASVKASKPKKIAEPKAKRLTAAELAAALDDEDF